MRWIEDYRSKLCSAREAVRKVRSGDRVYYGGNAAIPSALVAALAERADELEGVQLNHLLLMGTDPLARPEMESHFRHNSLFVGPADRAAVNEGRADYVPIFLHHIHRLFERESAPLDVAMVQVSPPDEHGFMSLGIEVLASKAACQAATTVIVQVNDKMPRVLGDCFLHVQRVDLIVEESQPLPELAARSPTAIESQIADHILGLIEPGATLQMGIGGIPDSVFAAIEGDMDLGIHTELMSDGAMGAIERGVVTGIRKNLHPGKAIITVALGTRAVYDFLDNNPFIEAHPAGYVNDPFIASQNDNLVAVNSALQIDLTGQVCSDSIGTYIYSGFGGQVDFIRAASRSRGGKPIIALSSTAKGGTISRIAPTLEPGAGVVTSRADVHYVATEYGVVQLFGKNLRQRAEALISIAHPDFRDDLERAAKKRKLIQ